MEKTVRFRWRKLLQTLRSRSTDHADFAEKKIQLLRHRVRDIALNIDPGCRVALKQLPMREQYAIFAASGFPDEWDSRYGAAYDDFERLVGIQGVATIGISWIEPVLMVGTEQIDVEFAETVRDLGEFIIRISQNPPECVIENVTRKVVGYSHPHVNENGRLCISGASVEIPTGIVDGHFAEVVRVVVTALRMDERDVIRVTPYSHAGLGNWPIKEGGSDA